jgi:hypothetical protein
VLGREPSPSVIYRNVLAASTSFGKTRAQATALGRRDPSLPQERHPMQSPLSILAGALLLAVASVSTVAAQQPLAEQVLEGCGNELETYCAAVTPGEGRLLACLYAHGDKLSGQCEFALYDAAVRLERVISALTYVASECRAYIESLCAGVQMGQGRIAQCLVDKQSELSNPCDRALTDIGLKE